MVKKTDIVRYVTDNIKGRIANKIGDRTTKNTDVLLDFVEIAGGGNHLEIGTLFGGSAIAVALLKKELGHSGMVFCIDPLNGYYYKYAPREDMMDIQSGVAVTPSVLFHNLRSFCVADRVFVLQANSVPFPPLHNITFSTAYIDGDHKDGVPLKDWYSVKDLVTRFVVFDNCAATHLDVVEACDVAASDSSWKKVYHHDITFVVERTGYELR